MRGERLREIIRGDGKLSRKVTAARICHSSISVVGHEGIFLRSRPAIARARVTATVKVAVGASKRLP